jgi:hypothetical protein
MTKTNKIMTRCQFIHAPGMGFRVDCALSLSLHSIRPPFSYSTKNQKGEFIDVIHKYLSENPTKSIRDHDKECFVKPIQDE